MLRDVIIKALKSEFGDKVRINPESTEFAVFAAKHHAVGDVILEVAGDEVTIFIGDITHGHFGSYEPDLLEEEHGVAIASEVVDFLADLFADKYLLFKASWGGGWTRVEDGFKETFLTGRKKWFNWSGPIEPEDLKKW